MAYQTFSITKHRIGGETFYRVHALQTGRYRKVATKREATAEAKRIERGESDLLQPRTPLPGLPGAGRYTC